MYDDLFTADKRESDALLRKVAQMKSVDDLLMEATLEAGHQKKYEAGGSYVHVAA